MADGLVLKRFPEAKRIALKMKAMQEGVTLEKYLTDALTSILRAAK